MKTKKVNYMEAIATMLGVELNEEFNVYFEIRDSVVGGYRLTEKGLEKKSDKGWERLSGNIFVKLLTGDGLALMKKKARK